MGNCKGRPPYLRIFVIETIYLNTGFSKREATDILEDVLGLIKSTLAGGETLKIAGFGNFVVRDKGSRNGRNPKTGEPLKISSRKVLTFKPSPTLRDAVNATGE